MKTFSIACLSLVAMLLGNGLFVQEDTKLTFDPAFAHVVYFWLQHPEDADQREAFETALKDFLANSRYAKTNFIGRPPKATREVVDDTFTYAVIITFASAEAQEAYQVEQAHLDFIAGAGHLWKKVVVYDALGLNP